MPANPEIVAYIRQVAIANGIDPEVALRVAEAEALNVFDPNRPDLGGDEGSSFGPFQLHYKGISKNMPNAGMGDDFTAATGLDARDPSTWRQQVDFALKQAARGGWSPWMGAKAAGITDWQGIGGAATAQANPQGTAAAPAMAPVSRQEFGDPLYPAARQASYDTDFSTPLADSLSSRTRPSGGSSMGFAEPDPPLLVPEFRPATPEAPPPTAPGPLPGLAADAAAAEQETPLASLFTVKDFGQARRTNPRTGGPILPTGWGSMG